MQRQNADSLFLEHNDAIMLRLPLLLEKPALNRRIPSPKLTPHDIPVALLMQTLCKRPVSVGCSFQGVSHRMHLTTQRRWPRGEAIAIPARCRRSRVRPTNTAGI